MFLSIHNWLFPTLKLNTPPLELEAYTNCIIRYLRSQANLRLDGQDYPTHAPRNQAATLMAAVNDNIYINYLWRKVS